MLCGLGLDVPAGRRFGQLAISMAEGMRERKAQCRVYLFSAGGIRHWSEPVRDTLEDVLYAARLGMEAGDFSFSLVSSSVHWSTCLELGTPSLTVVEEHFLEILQKAEFFQNDAVRTALHEVPFSHHALTFSSLTCFADEDLV